jgi:effector-binding domain-containing protein
MVLVEIKKLPRVRVIATRHVGPYVTIPEAFARVVAHSVATGSGNDYVLSVLLGARGKLPESRQVSYACIGAIANAVPGAGVELRVLPAGHFACAVYRGAYGGPAALSVHKRILDFIGKNSGFEPLDIARQSEFEGARREVYLNDPADFPQAEWLTEIQIPVRKLRRPGNRTRRRST